MAFGAADVILVGGPDPDAAIAAAERAAGAALVFVDLEVALGTPGRSAADRLAELNARSPAESGARPHFSGSAAELIDLLTRLSRHADGVRLQIWGIDLSDRDPDGPLPAEDPVPLPISVTRGTPRHGEDPVAIARAWREPAEAKNLTLRQVAIETSQRTGFAGTPGQVADELTRWVRRGASHGFNISPYLVPTGLDEIVDLLIPELQERNSYRTEYSGSTLREHLGLRPALPRRG